MSTAVVVVQQQNSRIDSTRRLPFWLRNTSDGKTSKHSVYYWSYGLQLYPKHFVRGVVHGTHDTTSIISISSARLSYAPPSRQPHGGRAEMATAVAMMGVIAHDESILCNTW